MKTLKTILIISTILIFSCKKQENVEIVSPTDSTSNDNILVNRIIKLDTTKIAPLDTVQITNFTYDNLKRLIKIRITGYPVLNANNDTSYSNNATLLYNGNDTIPYKSLNQYQEGLYKANVTAFFSISPTLRYDSSIQVPLSPTFNNSTNVKKIVFNGNSANVYSKRYSTNSISADTIISTFTKQNGNYLTQNNIGVNTIGTNSIVNFTAVYDNKNNPLMRLGFLLNNEINIYYYEVDPFAYGKNNNVTEINNTQINQNAPSGTIPSRVNYKYFYTYDSNNYPTEVRIQKVNVVGTTISDKTNKIKYYYTN
jgi:hypothetical protein